MLPFVGITDGAAVLAAVIFGLFYGFDWRVFCGLAVGNVLMLANFVILGTTAEKALKTRDFRRARTISGVSYGLRYVGIFAVLAGLLTIDAINLISAVLPLFYPKLYYTFVYLNSRSRKEEQENDTIGN